MLPSPGALQQLVVHPRSRGANVPLQLSASPVPPPMPVPALVPASPLLSPVPEGMSIF